MAKKATTKPAKTSGKGKRAPKKAAGKTKAPAKKAAPKRAERRPKKDELPSREDLFVTEYLVDLNGRQAAIRAGYSPQSARQTACDLLATPRVQEKVQAAMEARAARTGITADKVVERFWALAHADARELVEHYRSCCRYCWGKDNRFQRTPREMEEARADHEAAQAKDQVEAQAAGGQVPTPKPFDEAGGVGFDPRKDPNPACPECFGEGVERAYFKDTRDLSPSARLLYAGVKTTQHGLEVKMHDPMAALRDVGRHLGVFKDKVELTGKDGGPLQHRTIGDLLDEIDGSGTGLPRHGNARG